MFFEFELNQTLFLIYNAIILSIFIMLFIASRVRSERRFKALIENGSDVITITSRTANILYVSPTVEKVLGYTTDEFVKLNGLSLVHPDDLPFIRSLNMKLVEKPGAVITAEFRLKHKNGSWRWLESTAKNTLNESNIGGIVSNFRDITERKHVEEARSDFFWMAAHQLRTPLSNIKWNTELILRGFAKDLTPQIREKLMKNQNNTERMISQLNEILTTSRAQQFQFKDEPTLIDISDEIRRIVGDIDPDIQKKKLIIDLDSVKPNQRVKIGEHHFYEILQNVLSNSIKYNKEGGKISVGTQSADDGVLINIEDTGFGIPEKEHDKIFTRFFRATNIKNSEGTGLGLSLIKSYLDELGGKIWFESVENKGTIFHIKIPYGTLNL